MPRKTKTPRKPGTLTVPKNRRTRPEPTGRPSHVVNSLNRQPRVSKRPQRFPGRLGGR
ncbi:hypothetical protein [Yoonia sp. 2307UL14-13]|uniref:hypothetical protein n=1 Tax=Yoonia sp. 2307UL14-13 TaxID=3126506 RepID=UPI00309D980E